VKLYTATSGTLTFAANETTKTFTVPVANNGVADGNRALTVKLTTPGGGGVLGAPNTATVTVVDDEVGVRFSAVAYTVGEAGAVATITVVRTGPVAPVVTVQYATSDGTATAGPDYTARAGTLTFGANVTTASFTVPIVNDVVVEGPETVTLTLSSPGGALLGTPSSAVLTIVDNDAGGAIQFSAAASIVTEPASAVTPVVATVTVTRTVPAGMTAGLATVDYATSDGTATAGQDYTATAGTLTFPVGILSRTFTVPVLHDTLDEPAETVNLTLSNPTGGATLGARSLAVLTITDND
jgi:hypothetical protein